MSNFGKVRINHQITAKELRVIDDAGQNVGVMSLGEALRTAQDQGVDLIEVAPLANPPVAKMMEFGKYQYLENKKSKTVKRTTSELKSIQVKISTGDHDLEIKALKVSAFLKEGHRVRVDLFLPGRAKFLNQDFLKERLARLLKFVTEEYKIAEEPKKSHKGLSAVIEKQK